VKFTFIMSRRRTAKSSSATSIDPICPENETIFELHPRVAEEEVDYINLVGIVFGMVGFFLKVCYTQFYLLYS